MTLAFEDYKECPKCGMVVEAFDVVSTNLIGYGLNYKPIRMGADPEPFEVLTCPKCGHTDYTDSFKSVPEIPQNIGEDNTPTHIKYGRMGEKLKLAKKFKDATTAFLTASWFSKGKTHFKYLSNVLDMIIKCSEYEKIEYHYLKLGLEIVNQLESVNYNDSCFRENKDRIRNIQKRG